MMNPKVIFFNILFHPPPFLIVSYRKISKIEIPKATDTFKDSFLPSISISIILLDLSSNLRLTPPTSFPIIKAKGNFGFNLAIGTLLGPCSRAIISKPRFFKLLTQYVRFFTLSKEIFFSAPKAVFAISFCTLPNLSIGAGVIPPNTSFLPPTLLQYE